MTAPTRLSTTPATSGRAPRIGNAIPSGKTCGCVRSTCKATRSSRSKLTKHPGSSSSATAASAAVRFYINGVGRDGRQKERHAKAQSREKGEQTKAETIFS